ncbi:sulfotransferase family 2 domain-containing protein [Halomonas sp. PA16-9]|uniref:sulfotransferase family 2 domain-containing protein n=1 Tax=Halomonas sp. PA16-9 TaxID=2576841 RepID=UPI0012DAD508|nr:sulfotransferase family protein [Halomonas sp. PA16-9]
MNVKPSFKKYNKNYENYESDIISHIDKNPSDTNAKADLLRYYARTRNHADFESYSAKIKELDNYHIQSQIARYEIFSKRDVQSAKSYLESCIRLNPNSPMWIYYFLDKRFNYYEKLCEGLLYTAIPKNGSTSLKNFILDKVYSKPDENPHSQFGNPFFESHHFSIEEKKRSQKVIVIRDPISRIKSYYNKNIVEERSLNFELGLDDDVEEFFDLPLIPSFEIFLNKLWDYCLVFNDVLHHILPQSAYVKDLKEYDVIVDVRSLNIMVQKVSDFLDLDFKGSAPHKMVLSNKNKEEVSVGEDFLFSIYMNDYSLLRNYYSSVKNNFSDNDVLSFNPKKEMINFGIPKLPASQIKDVVQDFFSLKNSSLIEIDNIKKMGKSHCEKLISEFDESVEKINCHININDLNEVVSVDDFSLAVINKIKKGIVNVQDEMLKTNKLTVDMPSVSLESSKSIILTPHIFALPFIYENDIYFVFFAGFHSQIVATFNLNRMKYVSFIYQIDQKPPVDRVLPSNTSIKHLVSNMLEFNYELYSYLNKATVGRGVLLAAQHMGHSLWNDLTGIQRIEDNKLIRLIRSFVILKGADPYNVLENKFNIRKDLGLVRYSYLQWKEQIANCYYNNLFWIRITDNFVTNKLAGKMLDQEIEKSSLELNEVTVTFGLRMENRTWENQKDGWIALIKHLAKKFDKITVIIDGHNVSKYSGTLRSAGEKEEHSIVDKEKELVSYLSNQDYSADVKIISCIESTLTENLKAINKSDFFIAPWGAGLAKMRWVCNLPGIVLTSNWNLKSRPDLRIYDSLEYREDAVESVFLDTNYIYDIGNESSLVKSDLAQKNNFKVDIDGLLLAVDQLIEKIRGPM